MDEDAVERVLAAVAGSSTEHIRKELHRYGTEPHEREVHRVRMAILKLISEDGLKRITHYVDEAKIDYRDVLAWAEYPEQTRTTRTITDDERQRMIASDAKQYAEWLERYTRPAS